MTKSILYKIKNEYIAEWKQWMSTLQNTRYAEAIETLKYEGLLTEKWFYFEIEHNHYTFAMAESTDQQATHTADISRKINIQHNEMKRKCLGFGV